MAKKTLRSTGKKIGDDTLVKTRFHIQRTAEDIRRWESHPSLKRKHKPGLRQEKTASKPVLPGLTPEEKNAAAFKRIADYFGLTLHKRVEKEVASLIQACPIFKGTDEHAFERHLTGGTTLSRDSSIVCPYCKRIRRTIR